MDARRQRLVKKTILRIFGIELIRINSLIETARSTVSQNRAERSFVFCSVFFLWRREILKT